MLTMKEMESQTGLSSYTLRYYEKERIITPKRQSNGRRTYTQEDVEWILFVKQLRELNMPIETIAAYANLMMQGDVGLEKRLAFLEEYRHQVKAQIKMLQIVEKTITKQVQLVGASKKKVDKQKRKK